MAHFLIHPDGQRWRWTLYGGLAGALARSAHDFVDRTACEAAVRLIQRSVRCAVICYAGIPEDEL